MREFVSKGAELNDAEIRENPVLDTRKVKGKYGNGSRAWELNPFLKKRLIQRDWLGRRIRHRSILVENTGLPVIGIKLLSTQQVNHAYLIQKFSSWTKSHHSD